MTSLTYSPSHPIIFLFDFSNKDMEVPEYDPHNVVSANDTCVSIRTAADVDGDVTATLAATLPEVATSEGVEVFSGFVSAPSQKIALVTSENQKLLEQAVKSKSAALRVLVDELPNPSKVWVEAR